MCSPRFSCAAFVGTEPSAAVLAPALSDIVAVERNHFLFHELIGSRQNRAV
jgi:hypothetical protein